MFSVTIPVRYGNRSLRVRMAITISSIDALPARSPRPLTVHSTCRAPAFTADSELATASPRSLWQCTERTALSMFGTRLRSISMSAANSSGAVYPTVSGMLIVPAPALIALSTVRQRKSGSVRVPSSGLHSTSSHRLRASVTLSITA